VTVSDSLSSDKPAEPAPPASGSSFYTAMRILPVAQRQAMFEIYSFCRAVDDIADGDASAAERLLGLRQWQQDIDACYAGQVPPQLSSLNRQIVAFGLERDDFQAVIDGMMMDVETTICAPDVATLDLYCDRVASAVGRLSVKVFGMGREEGIALAHHLGRALQLTNILRDIDEDAGLGRVYLPREALLDAGVRIDVPPAAIATHPFIPRVCAPLVAQAKTHFAQADAIMRKASRRTVRAPRIMAAAYGGILDLLIERGWTAPRHKVKLPKTKLVLIMLRYAFI